MDQRPGRATAKYRQVAAALRARIEAGEFPAGAQLLTKPEIRAQYGVSLGTVDAALRVLSDLGMTESQQGAGTFVLSEHGTESEPELVRKLAVQLEDVLRRLAKVEQRIEDAESALGPDGP